MRIVRIGQRNIERYGAEGTLDRDDRFFGVASFNGYLSFALILCKYIGNQPSI